MAINRPYGHLTLVSSEGRPIQIDLPSESFLPHEADLFPAGILALQWSPRGEARREEQRRLSQLRASLDSQGPGERIEQTVVSELLRGFTE